MFVVEKLIIWIKYLSDSNHNQITKNFKRFFFSSRRRHTILVSYWSSDVCSSDLRIYPTPVAESRLGGMPRRFCLSRMEEEHAHCREGGKSRRADTEAARQQGCRAGRLPRPQIGRASCRGRVENAVGTGDIVTVCS